MALTLSLLVTPAASAQDNLLRDTTADRSRVFKTYNRDAGTLFKIKFSTMTANTKRRVQANLNISVPSNAADQILVATYYMYCAPAGSGRGDNKILGSQNILRGRSVRFNPHYLYTPPNPASTSAGSGSAAAARARRRPASRRTSSPSAAAPSCSSAAGSTRRRTRATSRGCPRPW